MGFPATTIDGKTVIIEGKDGNGNLVGADGKTYKRSIRPLYVEPVEEFAPAAVEVEAVEEVPAPVEEAVVEDDAQAVEDTFDFDLQPETVELTPDEEVLADEEDGTLGL